MPGNLLGADTSFPDLGKGKSVEERFQAVSGYLYMLLEQLRYTLNNLGEDNFNDGELQGLQETFVGPIEIRVEDLKGNFSELMQTVNGLTYTDNLGTTYISGSKIKSGTIEGVEFNCELKEGEKESMGKMAFKNGGSTIGTLCLDTGGAGTAVEAKNRMVLKTLDPTFVLKLESAGNASISSHNLYLHSDLQTVLDAGQGVRICAQGVGYQYEFKPDGIYYNGSRILKTGGTS